MTLISPYFRKTMLSIIGQSADMQREALASLAGRAGADTLLTRTKTRS
jgi:hypothetical protein